MDRNKYVGKQIGNYLVVKSLSRIGGFATVYQGKHIVFKDRAIVAIKLLHAHLASEQEQERFLQEARLLDRLKHPHILSIIEAGIQNGLPYLITEYATNGSLRERLQKHSPNPMTIEEAVIIISQIGQALQYAHQHNIVHRDLKPDNILFNARDQALLADFGIAVVLNAARTQSSDIIGTPSYMAPEQFEGKASTKSDQYALGCIAYELLTGHRPFTISSDAHIAWLAWQHQHTTKKPIPPTHLNHSIPMYMEQAILKAMEKQREDRHTDIFAFLTALGASPSQFKPQPDISIVSSLHIPTTIEADVLEKSQRTMEQWLEEGNAHFKAKRYEEALTIFEQVIRLDSKSAEAYYRIGIVLEELGRTWEAFAAYRQATYLNPKFAHAYIGKGNIHVIFKRYEEALEDFQEAIRVAPKLAFGYYKMGSILIVLNRYEEALAAYESVIRLTPSSVDAYYKKVEMLEGLKRYEDAIATYDRIIHLAPGTADAYYRKGKAIEMLLKIDNKNKRLLFISEEFVPSSLKPFIARLLPKPGYKNALRAYEKALQLSPNNSSYSKGMGNVLKHLGKFDQAEIAFSETRELDIGYPKWSSRLSNALWLSTPIIINHFIISFMLGFILQSLSVLGGIILIGLVFSAIFSYVIYYIDKPYHLYNAIILFTPPIFCSMEFTYSYWLSIHVIYFDIRLIICTIIFIFFTYLYTSLIFDLDIYGGKSLAKNYVSLLISFLKRGK